MLSAYFEHHRPGQLRDLRQIVSAFSDKRVALGWVDALLADPAALAAVAARSYPHPIGFDKLVLHDQGWKLRLHIYWRSPQELAAERTHLHRFEMASSPITGELTNHRYALRHAQTPIARLTEGEGPLREVYAYTGYARDPDGSLHQRFLSEARLAHIHTLTVVPGQTYVAALDEAHYVETNAETGHTNGDICSTIYVHGPSLRDSAGRTIPILFEPGRIPDKLIQPIAPMSPGDLEISLRRYRGLLHESLSFYDWLYDERYGRNLSVGLIAGYFLCEAFGTARTLEMWAKHRPACADVLRARAQTLARLVRGEQAIESLDGSARETRYFQQLVNKAWDHPDGRADWLASYGDLVLEFDRYVGALIGDYARRPDLAVLKPIWELDTRNLRGGAHYGHIWAMLSAARDAAPEVMRRFRAEELDATDAGEGPVTAADNASRDRMRATLAEHFPAVSFSGESVNADGAPPEEGARRWLVDPIDGTRNFLHGHDDFALSLAHQIWRDGAWVSTDAVVSVPARSELYWAELTEGAFHISRDGVEKRLRVPEPGASLSGLLVELSVRGLSEGEPALITALRRAGAVPRMSGCAALALCRVGRHGLAGAMITANSYDVAAGLLVAEESGAATATREFRRDGRDFVLYVAAASQSLLSALLGMLEGGPVGAR